MRQSRTKKAGIALAAGVMAFLMVSSPLTVRAAEPWDMENGQYVDVAGTPIIDAGYRPVVYANNEWLTNHMDLSQIPYDIWYARYGTVNNCQNRTIWQCTDEGKVDGIDGNVTIEFSFVDYSTLIPADGWRRVDGNWYYMKNYMNQTGWVLVDQRWFYLDPNGAMIHDTTMEIDGASYTFGSDGAMAE